MRILSTLLLVLSFLATGASAQNLPLQLGPAADTAAEGSAAGAEAVPSVQTLIEILENETSRNALIETLRASVVGESGEGVAAGVAAPEEESNIARIAAESTRSAAEGAMVVLRSMEAMFLDLRRALTDVRQLDFAALTQTVIQLGLAVAVVFTSFMVLKLITNAIIGTIARRAERHRGWAQRLILLLPAAMLEFLTVVLAWAAGYAFALFFGATGVMSIYQTLFLNAFLVVECFKVVARLVLMQRYSSLRLVPLKDAGAGRWYFWLSRLSSFVGYGLLFVVPVIAAEISKNAGEVARTIIVFLALATAIAIILQNRASVRRALKRRAAGGQNDFIGRLLSFLGSHWHRLAILYLVAFFVVWLSNPGEAVAFIAVATIRSVVAVAIGVAIMAILSRLIVVGLRLPEEIRRPLPLLEARLNSLVPNVLRGVRLIVFVAVLLAIVDAWNVLDVSGWLFAPEGQALIGTLLGVALILLIGALLYLAMASWVEYRLNPAVGYVPTAREITLLSLLKNAISILLGVILLMMVLSQLGVNIGPLIAGAGVFGLAISFGAQKFVQDVITGAFIQLENAMNTGDVVTAGGITGAVEKLSIRSVTMRSLDGTVHFVPFSSVDLVSNFMKHFSFHVAEIGVAYRENISEVKQAMQDAFDRLRATETLGPTILDDLEMHGVTEFRDSAVIVRARIKTRAGSHWDVGRAYNELIKEVFDERGIEIPFPHVTLYMGQDRQGKAPPLRVLEESAPPAPSLPDAPLDISTEGPGVAGQEKSDRPESYRRPEQDGPNTDDDR